MTAPITRTFTVAELREADFPDLLEEDVVLDEPARETKQGVPDGGGRPARGLLGTWRGSTRVLALGPSLCAARRWPQGPPKSKVDP
ncbi:hypothetical protein ACFC1R_32625 [Kitasatospora sp. NPDC056138]|uniref:hypothetical protein n=1 Tax=Kitasatospora sp. NPDC056138 TaxID=3345724 RepID=UPI0035DB4C48